MLFRQCFDDRYAVIEPCTAVNNIDEKLFSRSDPLSVRLPDSALVGFETNLPPRLLSESCQPHNPADLVAAVERAVDCVVQSTIVEDANPISASDLKAIMAELNEDLTDDEVCSMLADIEQQQLHVITSPDTDCRKFSVLT